MVCASKNAVSDYVCHYMCIGMNVCSNVNVFVVSMKGKVEECECVGSIIVTV